MIPRHMLPELAHLHREAAHWYSEKAAAYGRWEASRCRARPAAAQDGVVPSHLGEERRRAEAAAADAR